MTQEQQIQGNLELDDNVTVDDNELGSTPYEHIRERKVVIQPYDYAVRTLMDMIIDGDLVLDLIIRENISGMMLKPLNL